MTTCEHCLEPAKRHQDEHKGLCCDCFELSCGASLMCVNISRTLKGKLPILNPYPGRDVDGNEL